MSVYEEDAEAEAIWRDVVGVAPERIKRMGAADNFWSSGPTGPCGPCSELYYDFHPERGTQVGALCVLEQHRWKVRVVGCMRRAHGPVGRVLCWAGLEVC